MSRSAGGSSLAPPTSAPSSRAASRARRGTRGRSSNGGAGGEPRAAVALPPSQLVVDLGRKGGNDAFRDFERLAGFPVDRFASPQATTPSGGRHLFCSTGGRTFRNVVRIWGTAIDLRTAAAYVLLPAPGNGRSWLPEIAEFRVGSRLAAR